MRRDLGEEGSIMGFTQDSDRLIAVGSSDIGLRLTSVKTEGPA